MQHKQVSIDIRSAEQGEVLLALLGNIGFDGFEEQDDKLIAYIPAIDFDSAALDELISAQSLSYTISDVAEQNWNAVWEENFQPVIVPGFCTVRAHFHNIAIATPHEIVITPQMSFGTGHHATTMLMMMQMQHIDFKGRSVLDFGAGTGILAILAEKLGANRITAIDNDQWAYDNMVDNIERNNCTGISPMLGSLENLTDLKFDIILANINRNILLHYMSQLHDALSNGGTILMSGLLREDLDIIRAAAEKTGFMYVKADEMSNWVVLLFKK